MNQSEEAKIKGNESDYSGDVSDTSAVQHVAKVATGHEEVPACGNLLTWRCTRKLGHRKGCRPSVLDNDAREAARDLYEAGSRAGAALEREACAVEVEKEIASAKRAGCDVTFLEYALKHIRQRGQVVP